MNEEIMTKELDMLTDEPVEETIAQEECTEEAQDTPTEDNNSQETQISKLEATISSLEATIKELQEKSEHQSRMLEEMSDFTSLFPEVSIDSIPNSVWDAVRSGSTLPAAYALYEKRCEAERIKIANINAQNALKSAGKAGKNTANEYFSPEEVRKMSHSEVHANYSKIKESMKKWI